jgi:Ion channel
MTTPSEEPEPPEILDEVEVEKRRARATRRLLHGFRSADSYGLVFLMIVVTYVLAVSVSLRGASFLILVQIVTVRLSLHTSRAGTRLRRIADGLFVIAAACAIANLFVNDPKTLELYVFISATVLYFIAPIAIIRHIAFRPQVDQETMLGALCAYLLIGMAFAFTYRFIGAFQDPAFFGASGAGTLSQDLFFSFVTLTTTGYGNLVPARNPGQTLAVFEALLGQLFLVTAVGKIVTAWRPKGWHDSTNVTPPSE